MQKTLVIDFEKCSGCRLCEMWCSITKTKTCSPARSRIRVLKWEREGISIPVICQHCQEPLCALVCPVNAISRDEETGMVKLDTRLCFGCKRCIMACPFGALTIDPLTSEVFKCDLCDGEPVCAQVCPTQAIQYLKADRVGLGRKRQGLEKLAEAMKFALAKTEGS